MKTYRVFTIGAVLTLMVTAGAFAAQTQAAPATPVQSQAQGQTQTPPPPPPPPPPPEPQVGGYKETVVVSASKTEQQLVDAPATMTVIGPKSLNLAPSTSYGDLLRAVPGVNITQISARDVNVTSRGATSSLATSQLAVVDGRSIYQDFFGFVMWDFMPANPNEIKQIEVIRGPASAIWGANALNGVINVITKSPREMQGVTFTAGGGTFGRDVQPSTGPLVSQNNGSLYYVNATYAQAVNERWAYKLSIGTSSSDALARPVGLIPNGGTTSYPAYANTGTSQPKFDVRADYDMSNKAKIVFAGGLGATDGIMHSGIGPFDIQSGTKLGYGKMSYTRGAQRLQVFLNVLDGDAKNLLTTDTSGNPINFVFKTKTFDVEYGDTKTIGTKQALTYGGNLRLNFFDLTIAPGEDSRTEGGVYAQDEVFFTDMFRMVAGARVDKFSSISDAVFSPRVAFMIKPTADHTFRVSYNRAFRAPSMINNNLAVTIAQPIPLGAFHPGYGSAVYLMPVQADGYKDLTETQLDSFEIGYSGTIRNRAVVSAAWYYMSTKDDVYFTQVAAYPIAPPPPGFPDIPGAPGSGPLVWAGGYLKGVRLPQAYSYRNLGTVKQAGLELGVNATVTNNVSVDVNYSYQNDPTPEFPGLTEAEALKEINLPPNNRFNFALNCDTAHGFGSFAVAYVSDAFWQDVLDARYSGVTPAYTMVNATVGVRFLQGKYAFALKMNNLTDKQIQQHIFGDIMRRSVVAELRINLPKK